MKKATVKNKGAQGCMKISSFFSKQTGKEKPVTPQNGINRTVAIQSEDILVLDSEDEASPSLLSFKPKQKNEEKKRKVDDDCKTNISPPLKKVAKINVKKVSNHSPQPSTSGLTSSNTDISQRIDMSPSTKGKTPVKSKPTFNVKSLEKLLCPAALKEFNSPEKVMERFLDKTDKKPTPVKLNFQEQNYGLDTFNLRQNVTPEKNKSNLTSAQQPKNTTPKQRTKTPSKKSSGEKSTDNTPSKQKRTPKKLFERSPTNINEFNVEVLRKFIKITPSKKEVDLQEKEERISNRKSLEIQLHNEKTPVKDIMPSTSVFSPATKVRTKLNFSECGTAEKTLNRGATPEKSSKDTCTENRRNLSGQKTPIKEVDKTRECPVNSAQFDCCEKENLDIKNLDLMFDENDFDTDCFVDMEYTLDLTESQHCKIVSVSHRTAEILLTVKSTRTNEQAICALQDFWMHSKLCIGDTVHIKATKLQDNWSVDNRNGFLVFEPDLLLSVTSIVGSVYCKRKTFLQEKFRGFEGTNKFMIVGQMVHNLLQDVLKNKLYRYEQIDKAARDVLKRKEWVRQIYDSGESLADISQDFLTYVPKIHDFLGTYVRGAVQKIAPKPYKKDDWRGAISDIDDIEENIWCPDLGIKGKVDVSIKQGLETIPLEIKTGKASLSLQHRGQVLLYIMMMNKLGYRVSTGLLLYLKEGILREVPPTATEKRDIMILRNDLAYYMTRRPEVVKNGDELSLEVGEVPEPIDAPSCSKCPYSAICMAYSVHTNEDMSTRKSLRQVHTQLSSFLTSAHIDYFMRWSSLLDIEMSMRNGQKDLRDIYTLSPRERKNKGKCLINLEITDVSVECNGIFSHTFSENADQPTTNLLLSGFLENTYVVVSVENRPAVATGFVTDISSKSVTVSLDKNLNKKYSGRTFFLDAYDSTAFLTFNLSSLALILDTSERSNQLRSIIVDKQPASFQLKLPKALAETAKPILKRLNRVQQRAVLKAIAANEYFLIKGMPGTGKTATIIALIQLLLKLQKSVLITSHTHSAVDNVCLKLVQFGVKFMRLGSEAKMDAKLREYSEHALTKGCSTPEELEKVYNEAQVIAVTCLGSGHPVLSKRTLDICIVDESTQVLQCSVFRPLYAAKTFILIGDPDQLPAVVRSRDALKLGMNESLFERLNSEESRVTLNLNYRMNEPITGLANALTYNGELLIGAEHVAKATLKIPKLQELTAAYKDQSWLLQALDPGLENAVQFIDTGPVWNINNEVPWARTESYEETAGESQKCVNVFEAAVIFHLVHALIDKGGVNPVQIGVICTYRAQVAQLVELLQSTTVDVNTVDQFQGKDKSVVIYSCSKSKDLSKNREKNKYDLLEDKRRLNVAITRAKHKLIIVGDFATLHDYSTFRKIQDYLEKNVIRLTEHDGFKWDNILDLMV